MNDPQLRWLRLWTDIVDDAKLLLLAAQDRWYYIGLLCLKRSGQLDEGDEPALRDRKIALRLRYDERYELGELKRRLMEVRLIDNDWNPTGWTKRQYQSDQGDGNAAERMRRYRERKRNDRNRVTDKLRPEQRESRAEKDTEKDKTPLPPFGSGLDRDAFQRFTEYRKSIGKPLKTASLEAAQKALAKFGPDQSAVVEQTIANGWQGLFDLKRSAARTPIRFRTPEEIEAEEKARAQH